MERLQKILSSAGVASRRRAEELIEQGRVTVNGQVAQLGQSADPEEDTIAVNGRRIQLGDERIYIMLNKPRGYVTTLSDERGRKTVAELVSGVGTRLYPVGRLDMDSEGLLLFTNDGEFANTLMHPKHQVEKTYDTWVTGYNPGCFKRLGQPMELDGYRLRLPKLKLLKAEGSTARIHITIHEGRYRQVRRMCEIAGMKVTRLRRIREGALRLGDLPKGKWRHLTKEETDRLRENT